MKKYTEARNLLESKALNKEKKPIYATRKLSVGLVSCMLGIVLFAPSALAAEDHTELAQPIIEAKVEDSEKPEEGQKEEQKTPAKEAEAPAKEEVLDLSENQQPTPVSSANANQDANSANKTEADDQKHEQGQAESQNQPSADQPKADVKENKEEAEGPKPEAADKKPEDGQTPKQDDQKQEEESNKNAPLLSENEISDIRYKANNQKIGYFFSGKMIDALKDELAKVKADPKVNYEEAKARLINEAILKNVPDKEAPGTDRAVKNFNIKDADKLEAGMNVINVRGLKMETGQIIDVLVNDEVKGTFTQPKNVKASVKITISEPLKANEKVKAILKSKDGSSILAKTDEYTVKEAKPKLNEIHKNDLKMPTGEIWLEDYSAQRVNKDEEKEILEMVKNANESFKDKISSAKFTYGASQTTGSINVKYKDGSESGEIAANELKIKEVTEHSESPTIEETHIADGQITVTFTKNIEKGTKIGIVQQFKNGDDNNFCSQEDDTCSTGTCKADKSDPIWVTVESPTKTYTYKVDKDFLQLGQDFGVIVKEAHKFASCKRTRPTVKVPNVEVRNPRKLTQAEKDAIKEAVKKSYTREDGNSKLPIGTGGNEGIPAFIEVDDYGNVNIISGNDVEVTWDNEGHPTVQKNGDGTVKIEAGKESNVVKFEKEKILENKAPDAPEIKTDVDKGEITITPNKLDTDAKTIKVTYKNPDGEEKTVTATKGDNGKWLVPEGSDISVAPDSGVITLKFEKMKNKTNVSAIVTDEGGIANNDRDAKKSEDNDTPIRVKPKTPKVEVDNKTGEVTITPIEKKKDRVAKKMLVTYTPAEGTGETTVTFTRDSEGRWSVEGDTDFKVSEDGKKITIKNDKIKADTPIKAMTNDGDDTDLLKSDEGTQTVPDKTAPTPPTVAVDGESGNLTITPPTEKDTTTVDISYTGADNTVKTVKAKTDDNGTTWTIEGNTNGETIDPGTGVITIPRNNYTLGTEVNAKGIDKATNKSEDRKATPLEVSFDPNGGSAPQAGQETNKNQFFVLSLTFQLPECKFQAPSGKKFAGWDVNGVTKKVNDEITLTDTTVIKAKWESVEAPDKKDKSDSDIPDLSDLPDVDISTGESEDDKPNPAEDKKPDQAEEKKVEQPDQAKPNKPEAEKPSQPANEKPVEGKVSSEGKKKVVIPDKTVVKDLTKLSDGEREKIAEKIKEVNPTVSKVEVNERGQAVLHFVDGSQEIIDSDELTARERILDQSPVRVPRQDASKKMAGKNAKTGVESIGTIASTLSISVGALLASRKKKYK